MIPFYDYGVILVKVNGMDCDQQRLKASDNEGVGMSGAFE